MHHLLGRKYYILKRKHDISKQHIAYQRVAVYAGNLEGREVIRNWGTNIHCILWYTKLDQKQPLTNIDFAKSVFNISSIVLARRLYLINQFHANFPFNTPWKHQKTSGISDVFTGYSKFTLFHEQNHYLKEWLFSQKLSMAITFD